MNKLTAFGLVATIAAIGLANPAYALDRRVKIINNSSYDMVAFFASNKGARTWEENIFGGDYLPAGYSIVVNIDDRSGYCKFDFRAVFENGADIVDPAVNVCEVATFTYNN